ncbi:MAG: cell division protein ZapB [Spirochaetaceae bacterium]|jgi:SMC interacting uncharacterized protein involved in chromosome segregation|nr:cell division protein ZapB [Spirochaetaceae bacterium]
MGTLEHVKLLETKVISTLDFVKRLSDENSQLKEELQNQKKHVEELKEVVQAFKEDHALIEEGILSALNRLNQFEDAMEEALTAPEPEALGKEENESPPHQDDAGMGDQSGRQS